VYHARGLTYAELDEADGIQQKVRGNALRAKDELDRRHLSRELTALEESNKAVNDSNVHMRTTARWTIAMAIASIVAAERPSLPCSSPSISRIRSRRLSTFGLRTSPSSRQT
jgi:hypothetical protein